MKILAEKSKYHRFSFKYEYVSEVVEFCRLLKESFSWMRFNYDTTSGEKRWVFSDSFIVTVIKEKYPSVEIDPIVWEIVKHEQKIIEETNMRGHEVEKIKQKKDSIISIPGLKGNLYGYQKVGVEFLIASGGRAIIGDACGLGKTAQALAYAQVKNFKRVLVVTPASVKFAWANEIKKWTHMSSVIIDSKTKLHEIDGGVIFWVVNYDVLKRHLPQLSKIQFDLTIGDECVIPQTYVATEEGQKQIVDLKVGERVLTYNLKERIYEYKPVLAIVRKPLLKKLTRVGDLICTNDHKIYNGNDFVEAKDTTNTFPIGFPVLKIGSSDEVLAGCLMGDASLSKRKGNTHARLHIGNCIKNYDYIQMKSLSIDELRGRYIKKVWNGGYKPSDYLRIASLTNSKFTSFYNKTYKNRKRIVTEDVLNMMGCAGLAVWFQDDGSLYRGVTSLCTHRYGLGGNRKIKKWFKKTYGLAPVIRMEQKKDGRSFYYLKFNVHDSLTIYRKIRDYVVPSMRYKFRSLEEKFNKIHVNTCQVCGQRMLGLHNKGQNSVGLQQFCDICRKKYGTGVSYYMKNNIKKVVPYDYVYDLEIQDNHNFFADGILVHNCHMVKSILAQRTKAFRMLSRNIPHVVLLSGTPLLSRPIELFSLLNILDPQNWNNYYDYARKFCAAKQTRFGLDVSGASNAEELHNRIRGYFLRRTKEEVLTELPPKIRIDMPVGLDSKTMKEYMTAESSFVSYMKQYSGKQPAEIAKTLQAEKLAQLNVLRMLSARGKIETAQDLIESIIESGEKIIVFCSFVEPLELLKKKFNKCSVMLTGATPIEEREKIVKKFQEDKNTNVFLGGIKSAGSGITLTAASNTLFLDYSWNPADHEQASNRNHRPGVKATSVNIYQLHAAGTVDDGLRDILLKKQGIFDTIIDGKITKEEGKIVDVVVERILKKYK